MQLSYLTGKNLKKRKEKQKPDYRKWGGDF